MNKAAKIALRSDPITNEVVRNAYNAIANDMSAVVSRSAYSPIIYEAHDFGIAIFDAKARLLGQYAGLPLFTGGLDAGLREVIRKYGYENLKAGDVYTINDSYMTGGHLNDVDVVGVVEHEGELTGFICIRAHWADIGTAEPGFPVNSRNIFQEGMRWGPTRIVHEGEFVDDVIDLLCLNSRTPKVLMGDLKAQLAAIKLGAARMNDLVRRFGAAVLEDATTQIFDSTEAKFRAFIKSIPDGVYSAEGVSDNDGTSDEPVKVKATVTIDGDTMSVDTTGSSRQRPGNLNTGFPNTVSAVRLGLALLYPDAAPDINDGSFRALKVTSEPGSIFAAEDPAPCMRPHPVMLLIDLIVKALSPVLPKDVAAGLPGDSWNIFLMGVNESGRPFMSGEALDGVEVAGVVEAPHLGEDRRPGVRRDRPHADPVAAEALLAGEVGDQMVDALDPQLLVAAMAEVVELAELLPARRRRVRAGDDRRRRDRERVTPSGVHWHMMAESGRRVRRC